MPKTLTSTVAKKQYRNRVGVLAKPCSGTFGSWLYAFLGKTGTSPKVKSSVTLPFRKTRNCKGLEVPLPGFDIATSGLPQLNHRHPAAASLNLSRSNLFHPPV
ncbi:MAG: hypothetical protein QME83_09060, partial [Thermodesulfobacteriota bacterium]|nr:hypothetical protein [Thermodesulfobacteriota bacterium]